MNLISEVSRRLGREDWALIDLTLRQFGFPWTDEWNGDTRTAYVLDMIQSSEDTGLLALGEHLGFEFGSTRPQVEPAFWFSGYFRLFLSHLATHRGYAAELQRDCFPFGVSAFVAHNDIEPATTWQDEIESALATCDAMLVLLHPEFHESKWTDQEIGYAMGRQLLVVTLRLGTDPYGFIGRFQAMDGVGKDSAKVTHELLDILRRHRQTRKRIAESTVAILEESGTFARAKANMELVEKLEYWDSALSSRARTAVQSNGQISKPGEFQRGWNNTYSEWARAPKQR